MEKSKLTWTTLEHDEAGNALGYNTHNTFMRKYSEKYFDFVDDADIAIHIVPADFFKPVAGKFNVLFTMWESLEISEKYVWALNAADLIVVPSRFCKELFKTYTNKPIEVCWEGIESERYPFFERSFPLFGSGKKFRFLWIGAPNPRKGYQFVLDVCGLAEKNPDIEIYMKTTIAKKDYAALIADIWKNRREARRKIKSGEAGEEFSIKNMIKRARFIRDGIKEISVTGTHKNIILDTRKIPFEELRELYNSAHCFLLPTMGEGWGLTLCEAMATGCPSIATPVTGCADFFDEQVGFPIAYGIKDFYLDNYDVRAGVFIPHAGHMAYQMMGVYKNYNHALSKGREASKRIHERFTWSRAARRLKEILDKHFYSRVKDMEIKSKGAETPEEQQERDNKFLLKPGDVRVVEQRGSINYKAGEQKEVDIKFERKRNAHGGVDVVAHMPSIGMNAETTAK